MHTVIVDYKVGNLSSVASALEFLAHPYRISSDATEIKNAEFIILPGVGSFAAGMDNIKNLGLLKPLQEAVLEKKIPILGICLGMQLLATESEENGLRSGLNFIPGRVVKIPENNNLKIPNVGWHSLKNLSEEKFFNENKYFYFDHSYYFCPTNHQHAVASIEYGDFIAAMVRKDHIFGVQFHPEKSQVSGLRLLKRILQEYKND